jgi:two-component system response regulator
VAWPRRAGKNLVAQTVAKKAKPECSSARAIILLAEDDEDDVLLMRLAFRKAGLTNPVHVVATGAEAIEYLMGAIEAKSSGSPTPLLISLDIDMPMVTGFDVLNWIRTQPALDEVPVVVLSQSDQGKDANRAIQLGARSYLVKPASFDGLVGMIRIFRSLVEQVESRPSSGRPGVSANLPLNNENLRRTARDPSANERASRPTRPY